MSVLRDDLSLDRVQSLESERTLLGVFLLEPDAFHECSGLRVDDFSLDSHQRIYGAMAALLAENVPLDIVTLADHLNQRREIAAVGGRAYLFSLTEGLPRRTSPAAYLATIKEKARLRRILTLTERIATDAVDASLDSSAIASAWEDGMLRILDDRDDDNPLVSSYIVGALNAIEREAKRSAGVSGLSYGLPTLDGFTDGMQPGEVTVVGARSGVGKSSLMIQAAVANCRAGIPTHLFSLEMTRQQILRRVFALEGDVPYYKLRDPRRSDEYDRQKIRSAAERVEQWPLRIHDRSEMDISQVASLARLSIRKHGTRLIALDYAQISQGPGKDERTRVAGVSRTLTSMVKHENASLMLLSQLRKVDKDSYNRPPHIADLRETGQLENDCHVCLLLHRGWDEAEGRVASGGEIIIPKQRSGETGTIPITFDRDRVVFRGVRLS